MSQAVPLWVREAAVDPLGDLTAAQKQMLWMVGLLKVRFDRYLGIVYVDGNHRPKSDLDALVAAGVVDTRERSIPTEGPNLDYVYVPRLSEFGRQQFQRMREGRRSARTTLCEVD